MSSFACVITNSASNTRHETDYLFVTRKDPLFVILQHACELTNICRQDCKKWRKMDRELASQFFPFCFCKKIPVCHIWSRGTFFHAFLFEVVWRRCSAGEYLKVKRSRGAAVLPCFPLSGLQWQQKLDETTETVFFRSDWFLLPQKIAPKSA